MSYKCPQHGVWMQLRVTSNEWSYYACPIGNCIEKKANKAPARAQARRRVWLPYKDKEEEEMGLSASEMLERSGGGAPLLHGSDLPRSATSIKVKVTGVREAPAGFNSPLILDLEPVKTTNGDKSAWAVNKTNLRALAEKFGDDLSKVEGKSFTLYVGVVNNPKTNKTTRSLFVQQPE